MDRNPIQDLMLSISTLCQVYKNGMISEDTFRESVKGVTGNFNKILSDMVSNYIEKEAYGTEPVE